MSHQRYFIVSGRPSEGDVVSLREAEGHHLFRVNRAKTGDEFVLLDGEGGIYRAAIDSASEMTARIISAEKAEPVLPVDMALPMIKQGRMDYAVEKCAEMGIRSIIPFTCERSVWKGDSREAEKKRERFAKKVEAACKQSGNPWFTRIEPVHGFPALVEGLSAYESVFLADPDGVRFSEAFSVPCGTAGVTIGVTGPEGGLTGGEKEALVSAGAALVSLGLNRLRSETSAFLLASGMILCRTGG